MSRGKQRHKRQRVRQPVPILKWDAPELRMSCKHAEPGNTPYIGKMIRALRESRTGVGLAGPQVGVMERAILVWPKRVGVPQVMLNPQVLERGAETETASEGCLSYPGVYAGIERSKRVRVKWGSQHGNPRVTWFDGFTARIVQHEIDHLNGVCLVGDAWRAGKTGDSQ
jgi:peptide deformylase